MCFGYLPVGNLTALERTIAHSIVVYKSPQVDMGYDVSDYKDIDPKYGTLADVDELIAKLRQRDMKLMMDLVVNHTSDQVSKLPSC
jgi:glycosidase